MPITSFITETGGGSKAAVRDEAETVSGTRRAPPPGGGESGIESGQQHAEKEILALFREKMDTRIDSVETDLFHSGVFDSMTLVAFILSVEERFRIRFPMEDLDIESGVTVSSLAALILKGQRSRQERID